MLLPGKNGRTKRTQARKGDLIMKIEQFAKEHRLKITRDECSDAIIGGRRGQLYFDGLLLCAMWIDAPPMNKKRLEELGGRLWMGDISPHPKTGRRVQDVKVIGILADKHKQAIRMVGAKQKRIISEGQKLALEKARAASPLIQSRAVRSVALTG